MAGLLELLQQAATEPRSIKSSGGGAHLALVLNGLMVKHGFYCTGARPGTPACPPSDWNTRFSNEWIFDYHRQGCQNAFLLHCSLQPNSGKMFVQAREAEADSNRPCMGITLEKYVPSPAAVKQTSWQGVFSDLAALEEMFTAYIAEPLASEAVPAPAEARVPSRSGSHRQSLLEGIFQKRTAGIALMTLLAAVAVRRL